MLSSLLLISALAISAESVVLQPGPDGVQRAEITGGSYFFKPDKITVKAGVPVELTIRKESSATPHNFVLHAPEAGMDIEVQLTREPKKIAFVPRKPGIYTFYCDKRLLFFKSHRDKGMEGTLEVVE